MMKYIKGQLLTNTEEIKSADTILEIESDVDCSIYGVLSFKDNYEKVIQFEKINDKYKARLLIAKEDLPGLNSTQFYLKVISGTFEKQSNTVKLKFNTELIKQNVRLVRSEELKQLYSEFTKLKSLVESLKVGNVLTQINITNKSVIKPGMIPVALDEQGNFVACYPFVNLITEVNGQKAINGAVVIDSSMIQYKNQSLKTAIEQHTEAINSLAELGEVLSKQLTDLLSKVNSLDIRLSEHITNGIV